VQGHILSTAGDAHTCLHDLCWTVIEIKDPFVVSMQKISPWDNRHD
jgi:hypothetical protein